MRDVSRSSMDPVLQRSLEDSCAILFLCTGNAVRSAFCDLYARHLGCRLPVRSAATVYRNVRMMSETRRALELRGVAPADIACFRPRHVEDLLPSCDARTVVLGMTHVHLEALAPRRDLRARAWLLPELCAESGEVPDPVLDGADFAATFERLERYVRALTAALQRP